MMAPTSIYTRTHTQTHTYTHTRARCTCIAHIIIIFRTPLYCLRVSHMHGAPSLMVLTIWMQISERKPPKGFGMQRGSQQYYNFVPCTRRRRRTAGRHRIFYANFRDIFRFRPNNYYCFRDHGRIRCRKVTTGYRATGSCILYNIVYIRGKLRLARRGHSIVIELWYSAAEYVNQITYDEFGTVLGLYIYIYFVRTRIYIYYYTHSEQDNFLCLHNFDFYRRTEGVGVVFDVRSYPAATYIRDKD